MTVLHLVMYLIVPAVADAEDSYVHLHSEPVRKEGDDAGIHSQLERIRLFVCTLDELAARIEGLSLRERTSEQKVGVHRYPPGSRQRDVGPIHGMSTVFVPDLVAVLRTHGYVRDGKVGAAQVEHIAVVGEPETHSPVVLDHVNKFRID